MADYGFANVARDCGANWIAATSRPDEINGTLTLLDDICQAVPIYINNAGTVTGAVFFQVTQGVYTADKTNSIALYQLVGNDGQTWKKVAESANNATLWKGAANTYVTEPFSSTYNCTSPGLHMIAFTYLQSALTTNPVIGCTRSSTTGYNQFGMVSGMSIHDRTYAGIGSSAGVQTAVPPAYFDPRISYPSGWTTGPMTNASVWMGLY